MPSDPHDAKYELREWLKWFNFLFLNYLNSPQNLNVSLSCRCAFRGIIMVLWFSDMHLILVLVPLLWLNLGKSLLVLILLGSQGFKVFTLEYDSQVTINFLIHGFPESYVAFGMVQRILQFTQIRGSFQWSHTLRSKSS